MSVMTTFATAISTTASLATAKLAMDRFTTARLPNGYRHLPRFVAFCLHSDSLQILPQVATLQLLPPAATRYLPPSAAAPRSPPTARYHLHPPHNVRPSHLPAPASPPPRPPHPLSHPLPMQRRCPPANSTPRVQLQKEASGATLGWRQPCAWRVALHGHVYPSR